MVNIIVEGNIGSGKTTLLQFLEKNLPSVGLDQTHSPDVLIEYEPVDRWMNVDGDNLLELYYKNPSKYGTCFQQYVMLTILQQCCARQSSQHTPPKVLLCERSMYSSFHCFSRNMFESGIITPVEYSVLRQWFEHLTSPSDQPRITDAPPVDAVIYIRSDPSVTNLHMLGRKRAEEMGTVSLEYLERLHLYHEDWLLPDLSLPSSSSASSPSSSSSSSATPSSGASKSSPPPSSLTSSSWTAAASFSTPSSTAPSSAASASSRSMSAAAYLAKMRDRPNSQTSVWTQQRTYAPLFGRIVKMCHVLELNVQSAQIVRGGPFVPLIIVDGNIPLHDNAMKSQYNAVKTLIAALCKQ